MNHDERLDDLLDRWQSACDQGQVVSPEQLCHDCPELTEEFKGLVKDLQRLDNFLSGEDEGRSPSEADLADVLVALAVNYRPLRFHARGGLGEVLLARDEQLCREVALKRIREGLGYDPQRRGRFEFEAEITGRLEHPGIVPIYGLGRDGQGRPYYAMRFIRGETLEAAVTRFYEPHQAGQPLPARRLEFQRLVRCLLTACQTVAYAHSRGIVHRDLKPANVMLGPYGEVLVVDWGLAKSVGTCEAATEGPSVEERASHRVEQTVQGSVKGSPAYMSPEQAAGRSDLVGPASDIYSLGATLYTVLTGRLPIEACGLAEVLHNVREGNITRPRTVCSDTPAALEAVCLKAMANKPEDRYVSADALAADIEHWLADEPVGAWREPWTVRLRRWIRRHRTLVTAVLTTLLASLVLLAGFVVRLHAEKLALAEAKQRETAARQEAEQNLQLALGQIRESLRCLYREDLVVFRNDPAYLAVQDVLAGQLDRFARQAPNNEFGERVRLLRNLERLQRLEFREETGLSHELQSQLTTVRTGLEKLLLDQPGDPWAEVNLARTYLIEGRRLGLSDHRDLARARLTEAFDRLLRHAVPGDPYGRESMRGAAAVVTALSEIPSHGRGADHAYMVPADQVLASADTALAQCDRFASAADHDHAYMVPAPGEKADPSDRFLDYLARLDLLSVRAKTLFSLPKRQVEARAAVAALRAAVAGCPAGQSLHPEVLQLRATTSGFLAAFAMDDKQYTLAWDLARSACDDRELAIRKTPGKGDAHGAPRLFFAKLAMSRMGSAILRFSDRRDFAARPQLSLIARQALAALDSCQELQSSLPAEQQPEAEVALRRCRQELHLLQADLEGKPTH